MKRKNGYKKKEENGDQEKKEIATYSFHIVATSAKAVGPTTRHRAKHKPQKEKIGIVVRLALGCMSLGRVQFCFSHLFNWLP